MAGGVVGIADKKQSLLCLHACVYVILVYKLYLVTKHAAGIFIFCKRRNGDGCCTVLVCLCNQVNTFRSTVRDQHLGSVELMMLTYFSAKAFRQHFRVFI